MLTPEKIKAMDEITGFKTPTASATSKRAEEIRQLAEKAKTNAVNVKENPPANFGQEILNNFTPLGVVAKNATRFGQALGVGAVDLANLVSGGHLDSWYQKNYGKTLDQGINDALNKDVTVPMLGTKVQGFNKETPESTAGLALQTVGWGLKNPAAIGGTFMAGSAMEQNKSARDVALDGVLGTVFGKVLSVGLDKASPYITQAVAKYGEPFVAKFTERFPMAKSFIDEVSNRVHKALPNVSDLKLFPDSVSKFINTAEDKVADAMKAPIDKVKNVIKNKAVDKLESDYYKWMGETKPGIKTINKMDAKTKALEASGVNVTEPPRFLAENGVIPNTEKTKFRTKEQADSIRNSAQPLEDVNNQSLAEAKFSTEQSPLSDLRNKAIAKVKAEKIPEGDVQTMINDINSEFDLLQQKYGSNVDIVTQNEIKQKYWNGTPFDSSKPLRGNSYYTIGKVFQESVTDTAASAGNREMAQLNRHIGDIYESAKFLEKLDGQTIKGGKLGKYVFSTIGASLGNTIVGKAFGYIAGDLLGQTLINASVANPIKRAILERIKATSPQAYLETVNWINRQQVLRGEQLALPAPDYIPMGPENKTITPSDKFSNDMKINMQSRINTPQLPAPENRIIVPNTQGTPNVSVYPGNSEVGGMRQRQSLNTSQPTKQTNNVSNISDSVPPSEGNSQMTDTRPEGQRLSDELDAFKEYIMGSSPEELKQVAEAMTETLDKTTDPYRIKDIKNKIDFIKSLLGNLK